MAPVMKPGWSKPSTILFASEIPANQKAFAFAVAQAKEFSANLILLHVYDTLVVAASETSGIRYYDYAAAARAEKHQLEPLAEQVRKAGILCEVVVRPGLAATRFLPSCANARSTASLMGTHSPGPSASCLWVPLPRPSCALPECRSSLLAPKSWTEATVTSSRVPFCVPSAFRRPAVQSLLLPRNWPLSIMPA